MARRQNQFESILLVFFGKCSSDLSKLAPLPCSYSVTLFILIVWIIFLSPFLTVIRNLNVISFFPPQLELFARRMLSLIYDGNFFKSIVKVTGTFYLWTLWSALLYVFHLKSSFSCNPMLYSGCSALYGVNPNWKNYYFQRGFMSSEVHLIRQIVFINKSEILTFSRILHIKYGMLISIG